MLKAARKLKQRCWERPDQPITKTKALSTITQNQLYNWDITYLPVDIKGQF
jgi:hypothetical protein